MTAGCQNDDACVGGQIECWNPGGPCPVPNDSECDTCGPCSDPDCSAGQVQP